MNSNVRDILNNWKAQLNIDTDKKLQDLLEVSRPAMDKWISRNSIPARMYNKFNNVCKSMYNDHIFLRYYENVTASAGYGAQNDDENYALVPVSPEFLKTILKVPLKNYDVIRVFGDSMEPFAEDGDMIIIDKDIDVKNGDMIIANISGDIYMKKFLRNSIKNEIKLTSLNSFYQDITLIGEEIEQLKIIGKVKGKFTISIKIY